MRSIDVEQLYHSPAPTKNQANQYSSQYPSSEPRHSKMGEAFCVNLLMVLLTIRQQLCPNSFKWERIHPSPAGNYKFKVNNKSTRTRCEICSKLTVKTPKQRRCRSGVFIVNFKHISYFVLVFLLLTLNIFHTLF